ASLLVPRVVARWLLAVSALLLIASGAQGVSAPGRSIRLGLLAFLFSSGWTIHYQPGTPVDLFEDGQPLANAATYVQGGHPYLQTYPVHGWGADGGLDSLFFRVFGPSLQTFRVRRAIVTALALTALGLCSFSLFENLRWAAVALAACLCFCSFVSERQTLALLALALL